VERHLRPDGGIVLTQWLRRTHGWFGLWGATLGLLFGFSGIWLNHRAVLKLPLAVERQNAQIALPDPPPASPDAMVAWLRDALKIEEAPSSVRVEKARPVPWAERGASGSGGGPTLMQPERWVFNFGGPHAMLQIESWVGNRSVSVQRTDNGVIATLTNLHKGVGMPLPWILLVDTLAGSLIFLSLSGLLLWWQTHRGRRSGLLILATCATVVVSLAVSRVLA
jgi:hypothetical protein